MGWEAEKGAEEIRTGKVKIIAGENIMIIPTSRTKESPEIRINSELCNGCGHCMELDLDQLIFALSDTVDLVGVDEIMHGKRVGCMAWHCAETLGMTQTERKRLLQIGLLHDSGVSSTREHHKLVNELDWENAQAHCRIGSDRLSCFGPLSSFAEPVLHHHTHWDVLSATGIDEMVKIEANLIYLLDRVDSLGQTTPGSGWMAKKDAIRQTIGSTAGTNFHPELVDAFLRASRTEAFWFSLDPVALTDFMERQKNLTNNIVIPVRQLKTVAEVFAQIVDAKSSYTAEHSFGVASLAAYLGEQAGLDHQTCLKVEVAGLLHDLGKLQIPDSVLEKPGPLDGSERLWIQHHSYASYRILNKINGFSDIALWAANHHEALDGSGYPFHKTGDELDTESRILTVADIFQALAQNRPYREAQPVDTIVVFLEESAQRGCLDRRLVEMVADTRELCYRKSLVR